MSKSGVVGPILQVVGAVLLFIPGAQPYGMILMAAGAYQAGQYQKHRARWAYNKSLTDRTAMTATFNGGRSRVYGLARNVDGVLFKGTRGNLSQTYTLVVAFAGHEVDDFVQVYFNDLPVDVEAGTGNVLTAPYARFDTFYTTLSRVVSDGLTVTLDASPAASDIQVSVFDVEADRNRFVTVVSAVGSVVTLADVTPGHQVEVTYAWRRANSYAKVFLHKGAAGQDISGDLAARFPGLIRAEHKFNGIALAIVDLEYSEDVFPTGVPMVSALMRGAPVNDPRTGVVAWSDNPALCALDWALYANGGDCSADEVHMASFVQAANDCDISHTYTDSAGAASVRPLFRCGYVAALDVSPETHLSELVEAMAGRWGWAGGQLKVRAGVYAAPVAHIDEAWLSNQGAGISVIPGPGLEDLVNTYKLTIADAAQNHAAVELPALQPAAYMEVDGTELVAEMEMGAVSFAPQALHVAGVLLRDQRQGLTVSLPCNMMAWPLELFDVVTLTVERYGWASKQFEVLKWVHASNGLVSLTLKETGASIWSPDTVFSAVDQIPNTALPSPFDVPAVTGLAAESGTDQLLVLGDGTLISRIKVSWTPVLNQAVIQAGGIELGVRAYGQDGEAVMQVRGGDASAYVDAVKDGQAYVIRVRARNSLVRGEWSKPLVHIAVGKTQRPPRVNNFLITTQADGTRMLSGGYLASTRPADFAGYRIKFLQGNGPYTWQQMQPFQTDDGFFTTLPIETNLLLAGEYTLAIVGVDTTGNESAEPNFISAALPNPRLGSVIEYLDEQMAGWPGVLTDGVVDVAHDGLVVRARDQATWATLPATWAGWGRWVWDPVSSFVYVTQAVDFGASVAVLPVPAATVDGVVAFDVSTSADGLAWGAWAPIAGPVVTRFVRLRATVSIAAGASTGPGVTPIAALRALQVSYVGKVSSETGNDLDTATLAGAQRVAVGDVRLPAQKTWVHISRVTLTLQNVGAGWTWTLMDKVGTGPRVRIFNGSGALADALIDWSIEGIAS